jgi:transcriptional antiterminator
MTETEIAQELKVDQSTISRDIKALKELSQRFVFDLAKSDLAYYYKQCIDGIEVRRKGFCLYHQKDSESGMIIFMKFANGLMIVFIVSCCLLVHEDGLMIVTLELK